MINGKFLLLGSNLGDRKGFLEQARTKLSDRDVLISKQSSLYLSPPWGYTQQPYFLNQVICIATELDPALLMALCLQTEQELGRKRAGRYAERTIDIDILYYDDLVMATDMLILPHPRLHTRRFTLIPMTEIAPDFIHPSLKKTQAELLRDCPDTLPVRKLKTC